MSINLNQLIQGALTESVLQHVAARVGCAPESAKRVVALCGPSFIGAMMNKASSLEGARNLFATIMSPPSNALIAEELPHFAVQEAGFRSLVDNGAKLDHALASHDSLDAFAERIAEYTGVAASAARTLSGVVCATMFGLLKRHLSQHNGHEGQLPVLLGLQLPVVRANMTDALAQALGLGSVGGFLASVSSRLKAVSAHLEHPATPEAADFPVQPEASAAAQPVEQENACGKKWWWFALAAALALLAALLGRCGSTEHADKPKPQATPAAPAEGASSASGAVASSEASASVEAAAAVASPTQDPAMSFAVDASGIPTLTATVGSEEEKRKLIDELSAKLGVDMFHANVTVDPDTKPAA